jgi:hypothetical protein
MLSLKRLLITILFITVTTFKVNAEVNESLSPRHPHLFAQFITTRPLTDLIGPAMAITTASLWPDAETVILEIAQLLIAEAQLDLAKERKYARLEKVLINATT